MLAIPAPVVTSRSRWTAPTLAVIAIVAALCALSGPGPVDDDAQPAPDGEER